MDDAGNVLSSCSGDIETLIVSISTDFTCAATDSITTIILAEVTSTGDLLMISPEVSFGDGFSVETGGQLKVISRNPSQPFDP